MSVHMFVMSATSAPHDQICTRTKTDQISSTWELKLPNRTKSAWPECQIYATEPYLHRTKYNCRILLTVWQYIVYCTSNQIKVTIYCTSQLYATSLKALYYYDVSVYLKRSELTTDLNRLILACHNNKLFKIVLWYLFVQSTCTIIENVTEKCII